MYCIVLRCIVLYCIVLLTKQNIILKPSCPGRISWYSYCIKLERNIITSEKNYNNDNNNKKKNNNNNSHNHNNKIFIMRMKYKGKQKEVKKEMSDLQTEIPMIFISIILTVQLHFSFD